MQTAILSKTLYVAGCIGIVAGTLDPMEGSIAIAAGALLAVAGVVLGRKQHSELRQWTWATALIVIGVAALWGWSAVGGFGGRTGRSMWLALTLLPYPVGWYLTMRLIVGGLIASWRTHHPATVS
jgi:hypothetical protein